MPELRYVCNLCERRLKFALIVHAFSEHRGVLLQTVGILFSEVKHEAHVCYKCRYCDQEFCELDVVHVVEDHYNELNSVILEQMYQRVRENDSKE